MILSSLCPCRVHGPSPYLPPPPSLLVGASPSCYVLPKCYACPSTEGLTQPPPRVGTSSLPVPAVVIIIAATSTSTPPPPRFCLPPEPAVDVVTRELLGGVGARVVPLVRRRPARPRRFDLVRSTPPVQSRWCMLPCDGPRACSSCTLARRRSNVSGTGLVPRGRNSCIRRDRSCCPAH